MRTKLLLGILLLAFAAGCTSRPTFPVAEKETPTSVGKLVVTLESWRVIEDHPDCEDTKDQCYEFLVSLENQGWIGDISYGPSMFDLVEYTFTAPRAYSKRIRLHYSEPTLDSGKLAPGKKVQGKVGFAMTKDLHPSSLMLTCEADDGSGFANLLLK